MKEVKDILPDGVQAISLTEVSLLMKEWHSSYLQESREVQKRIV